jgi:hypothetical protein
VTTKRVVCCHQQGHGARIDENRQCSVSCVTDLSIMVFQMLYGSNHVAGLRSLEDLPYHFKKSMVCQFKNGMVCPPATLRPELDGQDQVKISDSSTKL